MDSARAARALGWGGLLAAVAALGCGAPARIAPEPDREVILVMPAPDPPAGAEPAAPEPAADPAALALVGVWEDPDTANNTRFTIVLEGGIPVVTSAAESVRELEVFEVRGSSWERGVLSWTYYVPSTRFEVTFTITGAEEQGLTFDWSNSDGKSGSGELKRVDPTAPPAEE